MDKWLITYIGIALLSVVVGVSAWIYTERYNGEGIASIVKRLLKSALIFVLAYVVIVALVLLLINAR